jgi:hypothetical protein
MDPAQLRPETVRKEEVASTRHERVAVDDSHSQEANECHQFVGPVRAAGFHEIATSESRRTAEQAASPASVN